MTEKIKYVMVWIQYLPFQKTDMSDKIDYLILLELMIKEMSECISAPCQMAFILKEGFKMKAVWHGSLGMN